MAKPDLNLLVQFDALMQTKSVSKAADRLGLTQPSMSAALIRLRALFHDPLLSREGSVWIPTQKAIELHQDMKPLLDKWSAHTSVEEEFHPLYSHRTLVLYATDYVQFKMVPKLVAGLSKDAPHFHLKVVPAKPLHGLNMLDTNHAELIAGYFPAATPELRTRFLFNEPVKCIVRNGHPCLQQKWTLNEYLKHGHIDLSAHTGFFSREIESLLTDQPKKRRVVATLSSYLVCPHVVEQSDLIATVPGSIAVEAKKTRKIQILDVPFKIPTLSISLYWHERHQTDLAHGWLRQYISSLDLT
ncbi:LysR family transcriptional regulator [Pollutimonas bauzanensis]|uniref:LysR family transcriptional regulator n=1 Tax=Pollutimonas bauzanensis TaxID=658167 RepID=UPI0033415001